MTKKLFALLMVVMALFMVTPAFAQEATPEASALPTIAEIVVASASGDAPEFTTLLAAVSAADPSVLETLSNPELESKLTVFAPTDAAFEAVGADTLASVLADQALLTSILQYHVVAGPVHPYTILNDMDMMSAVMSEDGLAVDTALEGQQIVVKAAMGDEGVTLTVNGANVVITDVDAANGVIHVIDAVLLPAS